MRRDIQVRTVAATDTAQHHPSRTDVMGARLAGEKLRDKGFHGGAQLHASLTPRAAASSGRVKGPLSHVAPNLSPSATWHLGLSLALHGVYP